VAGDKRVINTSGPYFEGSVSAGDDLVVGDKILHQSAAEDIVNRDKIVNHIQNIYQRALTSIEATEQARAVEDEHLAQGVLTLARRLSARAIGGSSASEPASPYKGLLEYRLSDADIFYGRSQAIAELLDHLNQSPLTVLHSEPGAGKTSLMQAGVSPLLIAVEHLPIYLRPYDLNPAFALKRAFLPALVTDEPLAKAPLRDFLSRVGGVLGTETTVYVFLDQFEEFFTRVDEATRPDFIDDLAECLEDETLAVRWLLGLRSDYFGLLASFRPRILRPFENDYRLNRLTRAEAQQAIQDPAKQRGVTFEVGLIDTVLDDLGREEIAPPQMQLVCSTLYQSLPQGEQIVTHALYRAQGSAAGILRGHLGRVLRRDLSADQRLIAQRLLESLITSDLRRVMRTRAELAAELVSQVKTPAAFDSVLNQLVDSRLLRAEETDGGLAYELAHDYLLGEVKLDPAVQARKAAQELLEQEVRAYQRHGTLLSDDHLAVINARRAELVLNEDARTLLLKSERALKKRQRVLVGGVGLVLVLVTVAIISVIGLLGTQATADQVQRGATALAVTADQGRRDAATMAVEVTQRAIELTTISARGLEAQSTSTQQAIDLAMIEADAARTSTRQAVALDILQGDLSTAEANSTQEAIGLATLAAESVLGATREAVARDILQGTFNRSGLVPVGVGPIALANDGMYMWVPDSVNNSIRPIDPETGVADPEILVGRYPLAVLYAGERVWVANYTDGTVQAINPNTRSANPAIQVGNGPIALAYAMGRIWVANSGDGTVQAIDPDSGRVEPAIQVGSGPIALVSDDARIWVANWGEGTVRAIETDTNVVGQPIEVGNGPFALAYDGTRVWVATWWDSFVTPITATTSALGQQISVGNLPSTLVFDASRRRVWVTNLGDGTVQAIDPISGNADPAIQIGQVPQVLSHDYDGAPVLYATSREGPLQYILFR
jgi:YVTN family beta-propeller protein